MIFIWSRLNYKPDSDVMAVIYTQYSIKIQNPTKTISVSTFILSQ